MTTGSYSFIDIAVLDGVRDHFAVGDPLVLLSSDLQTLLWVNGPGAALLGFDDIETSMGSQLYLGANVRRQIAATGGFPAVGRDRPLTIRLAHGLNSQALSCKASSIVLPGGAKAILLAVPGSAPAGLAPDKLAKRAIAGFSTPGHHAALVDAEARIVAASTGFSQLGIATNTILSLAKRVAGERDRLVKRMIPAGEREIAAGIGRLVDEPALHLLIAVDEPAVVPGKPTVGRTEEPVIKKQMARAVAAQPPKELAAKPEPIAGISAPEPETTIAIGGEIIDAEKKTRSGGSDPAPAPPPAKADKKSQPGEQPVRIVWKTDADGRFSEISSEFIDAVGANRSDIVGKTFREVAEAFGFDADGEIAGLLERRDTWSGRVVMWPLRDTNKRVPVDLAALPAYSRERRFEGFRGFGVVRLGEAVADTSPEQPKRPTDTGSDRDRAAESPAEEPAARPDTDEALAGDPFHGEKPAIEVAPTPERRESDKVIRLASRREKTGSRLSESEETAFREIGERLRDGEAGDPDGEGAGVANENTPSGRETDAEAGAPETKPAADETADDDGVKEPATPEIAHSDFLPSAFSGRADWPSSGTDISILEQLPVAVLIRSGDTLHYANTEFLKLTGYESIGELDQAGGFDVLFAGPDGLSQDSGESTRPAMRLVTRDGAEKLCDAYLRSVRWENRLALMLAIRPVPLVAAPPIEPVAGSPDELTDRVQELSAILDTATDGVVLVTATGSIRSVNRSAEALFGYDSAELSGKPFTTLFAVESQRAAADYLSGLAENGVASVLNDGREVIGRESQGRFIPLFMTMGKLPGGGYCAVLRDITQWKRAEEELTQARGQAERASSQKTDFLARISHEVRTPLNAIIGFSELMLDEKFGPIGNARYRDYLRDINRSGNHVLELVNDLLDISKIEAGAQEMDFESVSLNDALADAVAMMQPDANRERVIIRSSFASNLPDVVADLRSVRQIALNLLSNAIRFTPAGGQVIVSTVYEPSGDVIMRVRDTGIGMSRTEIDQALKPFKQVSSSKARRRDGTGLGLPLTKAMVEANRASFAIDSKPDEGTIVEIAFPPTRVLAD